MGPKILMPHDQHVSVLSLQKILRGCGGEDPEYQVGVAVVGHMYAVIQKEIHEQMCLDTFKKEGTGTLITKYGK